MSSIIIKNANLVYPSRGTVQKGSLLAKNGKISELFDKRPEIETYDTEDTKKIDASGKYVAPGFIDLQVNGGAGIDFLDASPEGLATFSKEWASSGCTGFLATIITENFENMRSAMDSILTEDPDNLLGLHIEGPFLSLENKGTHDEHFLKKPNLELFQKLTEGFSNNIEIFTFAFEQPGGLELLQQIKRYNLVPSLGHSAATFEESQEAIIKGVKSFTHLYNGMTGLHHRNPGCVGSALVSEAFAGLIPDGLHVHPAAVNIASQLKNDKLYLVTDAIAAAGLSEGTYHLGGQKINVKDGIARLDNGTISGSTLEMNLAVKNYQEFTGVNLPKAVRAATLTPARLIGVDDQKGTLEEGTDADLVIFDEDFKVQNTIIEGVMVYKDEN